MEEKLNTSVEETQQNFRVDLGGVIELLSRNLYSSPGVFVRELIQNAMDAITARDALQGEPAPRLVTISPFGVATANSPAEEFALADGGIGVSAEDVEQFLATVGASSKREDLEASRHQYIGQFGIGLLSCFLITDEITVESRSATGSKPIVWVGKSDGTYVLKETDADLPIGTTVRLRPRPDMVAWVQADKLTGLVRKYAEFLPVEISMFTNSGRRVLTRDFPWSSDFAGHRAHVLTGEAPSYGGIGFGRQFDVIHVDEPSLGLQAAIYIGAPEGKSRSADRNRVYVNNMLVDDDENSLMPPWAFFAWAVVNSTMLEPTASRESVMADSALAMTRQRLGQAALAWLNAIADSDPERFAEFVLQHELELKSAATQGFDREKLLLASVVLPMLSVQTTEGVMRLADVAQRSPNILFAGYADEFRTIASFNPKGRLVVNAGHVLDREILQTLPQVMLEVTVTRVYPASEIAGLATPPLESAPEVIALEKRAQDVLIPFNCDVAIRHFPSNELPAVFIDRGQISTDSPGYGETAHLVLNWGNRVVRALAKTQDPVVFERVIQLLFVQARMAGQHDGADDRALLSASLDDILALAVGLDGRETL